MAKKVTKRKEESKNYFAKRKKNRKNCLLSQQELDIVRQLLIAGIPVCIHQ